MIISKDSKIIIICLILILSSCSAVKYPLRNLNTKPSQCTSYQTIVCGVAPPDLSELKGQSNTAWFEEYYIQQRNQDNERLISILRSSGLFAKVDYIEKLSLSPDLIITSIEGPPPQGDADATMGTGLTLGILPSYKRFENGIYFKRLDKKTAQFRCDWPQEIIYGWVSYLYIAFSDDWGCCYDSTVTIDFKNHVNSCLCNQLEEILHKK